MGRHHLRQPHNDFKMGKGLKKHQKRLSAPSHWLLDKLSGAYAPRPSPGPHKLRDCMPLIVFIRNRLKYALNARETKAIVMQRLIKVDGKVRTDATYPAFHGCHQHREDWRALPSCLRHQGPLHRPPNPGRGGFNIVHIKDAIDNSFATRENNVFVIGTEKPWISLPKGKGVKLSIAEERDRRRAHAIAGN